MDTPSTQPAIFGGQRAVPSCPPSVVSFLSDRNFSATSPRQEGFHALLARLCCDLEMEPVWATISAIDASGVDHIDALMAFFIPMIVIAGPEDPFKTKTNPERLRWLADARNATRKLIQLLYNGPTLKCSNVIECIPLDGMRWMLAGVGVKVVPGDVPLHKYDERSGELQVDERTVTRTQESTVPLWLDDLLEALLEELSKGVPSTQTISKPRDAKAFRASYILRVTEKINAFPFHLTDEQVAAVARVALQDDAITPALANRFRWRPEKSMQLGAIVQDSGADRENVG